ncbi:hypothetical protein MACK_000461 [Theileria orientalis]|uniref:Uncharacterized protein n=1 Tax=Theileria orientalis TaxID=68886 RepID=A0A976M9P0_THEOR|nr:hypothetical protein MACK_000461 [Theileria orientalis]
MESQAQRDPDPLKVYKNEGDKPLYPPKILYDVQYTLDQISDSVSPFVMAQGGLKQDQHLVEGRDFVNIDMKSPDQYIGKHIPSGDNYIHSIDIDLSPIKAGKESGADDGLLVDDSRPPKESQGSGDEKMDLMDSRAPKVEKLYSDDDFIDVVDGRSQTGCPTSGSEQVGKSGIRGRTYVPFQAGGYGSTFSGYGTGYGTLRSDMYHPLHSGSGSMSAQAVEISPLGMARGAGGVPQPIPFPTTSSIYVEEVPIVPARRPRAPNPTVRVEGAAEVEEVIEGEDDVLIEEVFETESDKEAQDFDVVVVTAPEGKKVTIEDIKDKEKEASDTQTKVTKEQMVSSVITRPSTLTSVTAGKPAQKSQAENPKTTPAPPIDDNDIFSPTYEPIYANNPHSAHIPLIFLHDPSTADKLTSGDSKEGSLSQDGSQIASLIERINEVSQAKQKVEVEVKETTPQQSRQSQRSLVKELLTLVKVLLSHHVVLWHPNQVRIKSNKKPHLKSQIQNSHRSLTLLMKMMIFSLNGTVQPLTGDHIVKMLK